MSFKSFEVCGRDYFAICHDVRDDWGFENRVLFYRWEDGEYVGCSQEAADLDTIVEWWCQELERSEEEEGFLRDEMEYAERDRPPCCPNDRAHKVEHRVEHFEPEAHWLCRECREVVA